MNKKKVILPIIIIAALLSVGIFYVYNQPEPRKVSYNEFLKQVQENKIAKVYLNDDDLIKGVYKNGLEFVTDNPRKEGFKEELLKKDIAVDEMKRQDQIGQIGSFALTVVLFGGVLFALSRKSAKQVEGKMNRISSLHVKSSQNVNTTFSDVAGNDEAKESVQELIDFIKNPEKYAKYGARLPRGIIFYGPPGTGKTLLAKAVAGEADVPFYAMSGADFVQVYVGVGAARIRDLFKKARESGKCVIFIDEIDALGKKRDGGMYSSGNDERDQTLNALLAEMSGFSKNDGIVVIAATNRLDILDEALLRPGRFDRHIEVGLPDVKGRLEILKLHSRNKPIANDVDLNYLAQQTVYFSGAKLENLMNEAAIMAARRDSGNIGKQDIDRAFYTVIAGSEKKDKSTISEIDRKITAFHEAGHALITKLLVPENKVSRVTIIPSTRGTGGFSMNIPPDRMYFKKKDMENSIRISLAGRAAEEIVFGESNITTGAANDLEKATQIMLDMVRRFGMKVKSGLLNYDVMYRNGMEHVYDDIVQECRTSMELLYKEVKQVLSEQRPLLNAIVDRLLFKETLDENDLDDILEKYKKNTNNIA